MAEILTKDKKEFLDELAASSSAFEALERDFQEVLTELASDDSLDKFRQDYEKLHRALKKSHENEKRLIKKCMELNAEIVANSAKVQTALKLSQEDQNTIGSLKKEIEKAWKMVDAAHEKEARAKETIQQLKVEINNLSKLVEQGAGLTVGQENTVNELIKVKEELTRERDTQGTQIVALKHEIVDLGEKVKKVDAEKQSLEGDIENLRNKTQELKNDYDSLQFSKAGKERQLKELKQLTDDRLAEIRSKAEIIQEAQEQISRLEHQLKEQKANTEKATREYESMSTAFEKLAQQVKEKAEEIGAAQKSGTIYVEQLRKLEDDVLAVQVETAKTAKVRDSLQKKCQQFEVERAKLEDAKEKTKGTISELETQIASLRVQQEQDKKQIDELTRERDILNKNMVKTSNAAQKHEDDLKSTETMKGNLAQELQGYVIEKEKRQKLIRQLEKETKKYQVAAEEALERYLQAVEEVKAREFRVEDLQKKIVENEDKLKQQQNLYEAVRADRNLYSKNLNEALEEIQEMKRKFKIMNHQIDQLKEEIVTKDRMLMEENINYKKIERERETLKNSVSKLGVNIDVCAETIASNELEINKLNQIIHEADRERQRQKKEYENVISERDILGTQLIRRNDELSLLYEKIRIQQSTLGKGEAQYQDRIREIMELKQRIAILRQELIEMRKTILHVAPLRAEATRLQREVMDEKMKVKALSDELENPMNVHRWRKMEGSDPAKFEMIQKIQTLQRRLIQKTQEAVEKDSVISEKEKMFQELKQILARQPGPEVAEQVQIYEENLKKKTAQTKVMESELTIFRNQAAEYKYEIERLAKELSDVKKRYFDLKKKDFFTKQATVVMPKSYSASSAPDQPRFTGGGFSLG